ncbi:MAG: sigma-70 family RNA polymerase sigma factor [Clostridia bacterium]|nr:sigma-70 family RNA polymerase sigma factor [Clostridia bacterium]
MEDERIVDLFWKRSETAIEETNKKYGRYVRSIALNILGCESDAEEAVNDTYLDTWNSIPPNKPKELATYIGKIARRRSVDIFRKKKSARRGWGETTVVFEELEECLCESSRPDENLEAEALSKAINYFLHALPEREQKVFLCRYYYVESIETIADRFSLTNSAVKSILLRTRNKLKQHLIQEGLL